MMGLRDLQDPVWKLPFVSGSVRVRFSSCPVQFGSVGSALG